MTTTVQAVSYSLVIADSFGDYIHGETYGIKEVFIPQHNLCYNTANKTLNIIESSRPRVVDHEVSQYRNKITMAQLRQQREAEREAEMAKHRMAATMAAKQNAETVTIDWNNMTVAAEAPVQQPAATTEPHELSDEVLVPQFTQKLTLEGKMQTIELPIAMVERLLEIWTAQKRVQELSQQWLNEYK